MNRLLLLCLLVYAPHLVEEHVTRMCDDPILVRALGGLASMPARQAAYLVFQVMLAVALGMTYLFSRGGRSRDAVMIALGVALLAESHHLARWLVTREYNPGLLTALPMPFAGAWVLRAVFSRSPALLRA